MAINKADSCQTIHILTNLTRAYAKGMMDLQIYWKLIKTFNVCTFEDFNFLDKYAKSHSARFSQYATIETYNLISCGFMCREREDDSSYVFTNFAFYFRQFGLHLDEILSSWQGDKILSNDMELLMPCFQVKFNK
jgi:hypothetical protein